MNPIFNTLTVATLDNIEDQLANNEVSTNEELWDFFIEELGLTAEQADAAVALHPRYLGQIFLIGQSPLYQCGFHADSDTHSTHIRTVIPR